MSPSYSAIFALSVTTFLALCANQADAGPSTLDAVRGRGMLNCGVNTGLAGFSQSDANGSWQGLDVDYCRAIAAAVLGNANKVNFVAAGRGDRFDALLSDKVDVLIRNTTWTSSRESSTSISFVGVNYYDGQGFLLRASRGAKSIADLNGSVLCVGSNTTSELNAASYFNVRAMTYTPLTFDTHIESVQAYLAGRCDAYTADMSSLYGVRVLQARPADHVILPEVISKEPLGPSVRQGDERWFTIVKWVHFALLNAEELGVTQLNVNDMTGSTNPDVKRLLGSEGTFGKDLGLESDFARSIISAVGNYGEIYERNLGSGSRLKIARGLNKLWRDGGLQYAPPIR